MHEPRGHAEMYGAVLVEPDDPAADLAVLFLHGPGYSTMCGHAIIALGRWAVDSGRVEAREPETVAAIQTPCGLVRARVQVWRDGGGLKSSDERRVGKECGSPCTSRWSPHHKKNNQNIETYCRRG